MHLLYCDESNMEERAGDFLIYAGLAIDGERALDLSQEIDAIRVRLGVPRDYRLKFNPGPEGFTHAQFIELKRQIIAAAVDHGVGLLAYVVLHNIATNPDEARRNGINTVCFHFDCLLNRRNDSGLVLIDRFNDAGNQVEAHLAEDAFGLCVDGHSATPAAAPSAKRSVPLADDGMTASSASAMAS